MKLLGACWRLSVGIVFGPIILVFLMDLSSEGFSWAGVSRTLVSWVALSLFMANLAWLLLRRRARAAGIGLTEEALDERQTHRMRTLHPTADWQDQVRERLLTCERAFLVAEKGREEVWFRWRPGRSDSSVWGSLAFDAASGTVLVDLRDGEGHLGVAGLRRGTAFVAVCQVARALELTGAGA